MTLETRLQDPVIRPLVRQKAAYRLQLVHPEAPVQERSIEVLGRVVQRVRKACYVHTGREVQHMVAVLGRVSCAANGFIAAVVALVNAV